MMKRRTVLKWAALSPIGAASPVRLASTDAQTGVVRDVSSTFFTALRGTNDKRQQIVDCANAFCRKGKPVPEETPRKIVESGESAETGLRRARFGVRILTEYGITGVIDESMVDAGSRGLKTYTRYLPLLGSYNNCRAAACAVEEYQPETIERFLYAALAFGVEVALWSSGAPYVMAWRGTRFVANRTFLRLAKRGCAGCVAFAMSEIHWALRGTVYNADEMISERAFVLRELRHLQRYADEIGYEVEIEMREDEMAELPEHAPDDAGEIKGGVGPIPQQPKGFFERYIPEIDIDLRDFLS